MILPNDIPVYGDPKWRGKCPQEYVEQASFFSRLRREYPKTWGLIALHPRNEGLKEKGQFSSVLQHKAEGMAVGAADIIIPARVSFVVEMKRCDSSQSKWQPGQVEYLRACQSGGAFAAVAFGAVAAWEAFEEWRANVA